MQNIHTRALTLVAAFLLAPAAPSQDSEFLREGVLAKMRWRSIGPVNFGGRIVDIEVHPENRSVYYVATGSGGLWKTTTNGNSFQPIFDSEATVSIGDIAIAPSDPDVIYVGTGEANNQRSSYWGDGIYKSTNGGRSWDNVGLRKTDHIGRIVVHPGNADLVYVAAAGALYSPNPERGLYRSRDGGSTWKCVKFISDDVGFIDVVLDPNAPDTLYAASYERRRRAHHFDESGPGSAIWKSTDGGDTWTKLGGGLPDGDIGRIGLALYPRDGKILYAAVENANPAPRRARADGEERRRRDREAPGGGAADEEIEEEEAEAPALQRRQRKVGGEIYRSDDGGDSWKKTNERSVGGSPGYYYGQIRVDPNDDKTLYVLSVSASTSVDGGAKWSTFTRGLHADHHALWIDPTDSKHLLIGNDGGLATSWDRGKTWAYHNDIPLGQFYAIGVDMRDPYWVYGGTQDNGTWGIPSRAATSTGLKKADAVKVNGGDGFYVAVDPNDPNTLYAESQFGRVSRINTATGERRSIQPRAQRGSPRLRYNWSSPIALSVHNPYTVYFGTQHLHRSRNRGDKWATISPDLTTNDAAKIKGNVPHCTITTISESPLQEGLLWVGTDDGKVWVTKNDGERWADVTDRLEGLPKPLWVSRVAASPSDVDVAYVSFTGYREDIREPFVYLTTDCGETFRPIANNLPRAPVNVIAEHPRNPDVLFVGTEFGVHASLDGGATWTRLGRDLPTTPVHDLVVHPRDEDLILGTHGRGLFVADITPLRQLSASILARSFHAFPPRDGHSLPRGFSRGYTGGGGWTGRNPTTSASFSYYLRDDTDQDVKVEVLDATGRQVFERSGSQDAGLHVVTWSSGRQRGGRGRAGAGRQRGRQSRAGPGQYVLRITHGQTSSDQPFWIHGATGSPLPRSWGN